MCCAPHAMGDNARMRWLTVMFGVGCVLSAVGAGVAEVGTRMVLDGAALTNLEVLVNAQDGTVQGSLWQLLNKTTSPFGKVQICVRL